MNTEATLMDRIESANKGGRDATLAELASAAEWWLSMHEPDTIDLTVNGRIAAYDSREGSVLYVWLGDDTGEWHVMANYAQAETNVVCPVSTEDEQCIETLLDEFCA